MCISSSEEVFFLDYEKVSEHMCTNVLMSTHITHTERGKDY